MISVSGGKARKVLFLVMTVSFVVNGVKILFVNTDFNRWKLLMDKPFL